MIRLRALCVATLLCANANVHAQQKIDRGFAATGDVSMRIYVALGSVRVVAWDRDSINVSGTLAANAKFFGGAGKGFAKLGAEPVVEGDSSLPSAHFVVMVPRKAHVWLKMINGEIETDGTQGELELYTVGGNVVVHRAAGVTSVESIDAPVTIDESVDDLRVRGGKGAVTLRNISGTASITTISGGVELSGKSIPAGRIETIGGAIAIVAKQYRGALLELQTHSGDITLHVDPAETPELDLQSRATPAKKYPAGSAKVGRVVARSFKGAINVFTSRSVK